MKLNVVQAFGYSILGMAIVFLVLIALMAVIGIMARAMQKTEKENSGAEAPSRQSVPAPGSAGKLTLRGVSDSEAAMIMAIVADKMHKPLNELRFVSIARAEDDV